MSKSLRKVNWPQGNKNCEFKGHKKANGKIVIIKPCRLHLITGSAQSYSQPELQICNVQTKSSATFLKVSLLVGIAHFKCRREKHSSRKNITRHRGCVNFPPSPRALSLILFYFVTAGRLCSFPL